MGLEVELDNFLKIKTNGRDDSNSNFVNYPYEATPYSVLQYLANSGYITKKDKIIDFGCGKGRVDFFLAYSTKAQMIGVEYDLRLYNTALLNQEKAISRNRVMFINSCASQVKIESDVTGAYFFNPFSLVILKEVINNLKKSKEENNRNIKLFFYYPSTEYLSFLENDKSITHIENIECDELFKNKDLREYIAVYEM